MPKTAQGSTGLAEPAPGRYLYEQDEHEWIAAQVAALAAGRLDCLDRPNLIEYLTEMTIRDRREPRSRLVVLLHHMLKLQFQPGIPLLSRAAATPTLRAWQSAQTLTGMTRSWVTTILEQQSEIRAIIDGIPSLGRQAEIIAASAWPDAVRRAARETGLPASRFPAAPIWTVADALAFDPPEPAARGKRHH